MLRLDAGHPEAVVELAAGARLAAPRRRRRRRARGRAPGTGAGRCCGRGGTGMRSSEVLLDLARRAAGRARQDPMSAADCGCSAGADLPTQARERPPSSRCRPSSTCWKPSAPDARRASDRRGRSLDLGTEPASPRRPCPAVRRSVRGDRRRAPSWHTARHRPAGRAVGVDAVPEAARLVRLVDQSSASVAAVAACALRPCERCRTRRPGVGEEHHRVCCADGAPRRGPGRRRRSARDDVAVVRAAPNRAGQQRAR